MQEETAIEQKAVEKVLRSYLNILLYDLDRKFHKYSAVEKAKNKDEKIILFEKLLEKNYTTQKKTLFLCKAALYNNQLFKQAMSRLQRCYRRKTYTRENNDRSPTATALYLVVCC